MPTAAISAGIGAGGSILGGILGGGAARKAAGIMSDAYNQAGQLANQGYTQANQQLGNLFQQELGRDRPFLFAGQNAVNQLGSLMNQGGFQAPTGLTMQNDPGYQARLSLGEQALQNSAAARGNLLSGNTAADMNKFAQDYASNEYGNVYNRALNTFQTNYNGLAGLAGMGLSAAGNMNQGTQNRMGSYADLTVGNALQRGQDVLGGAGARAGGILGQANSMNNMIGGLTNMGSMLPYQLGSQQGGLPNMQSMQGLQLQQNPYYADMNPMPLPPNNRTAYGS